MHLRRLNLEHFKGLRALEVSFLRESGAVRPLTLLLGANGSGKTSVLQAIAFVLSLATRKIAEPGEFNWPGFLLERMSSGGPTRVELEVGFDPDELAMLPPLFARWRSSVRPDLARTVVQPDAHPVITLVYEDGALRCAQGDGGLSQCLGRYFAAALIRHPGLQSVQPQPGAVFWYHQHRNLFMTDSLQGIEPLRQLLVTWYAYHTSPRDSGQKDILQRLESQLARIFPGTRFVGVEPRPGLIAGNTPDSFFLLNRDGRTYDISEMSSGEQAVFPLIYEFVRFDIVRSVVLLDELELHLHPPEQQTLLSGLRSIGPDCQFIVTSHSPYLESVVPDEDEVRLEGGLRCL